MPRRAAAGRVEGEKFTLVKKTRVVEKADWKPPTADKWCGCYVKDDGKACARGCELRQQRRECVDCVHGQSCTNQVIQREEFRAWTRIQCGERGEGLALEDRVSANTIVLEYVGELITMETAITRLELNRGSPTYMCEIVHGWVLDGRRYGSAARWINSSHKPNCVLETWWVKNTPRMVVRTLRDIEAGEELLVEYGFMKGTREPCLCEEDTCTGWIGQRKSCDRAPVDPSTWNEPETPILPTVSRVTQASLKQYGLIVIPSRGDGHCLFHSFASIESTRTHHEWRQAIADDIESIADENTRRLYVERANNYIRDGRTPFKNFSEYIKGIR
eukprot:1416181-Rhodomonas_salina.1